MTNVDTVAGATRLIVPRRFGWDRALLLFGLAVLAAGALSTEGFLSVANYKAILANVGVLGIVAAGMTFITVSGNLFSLSLGATLTVCSMCFLATLQWGTVTAIGLTVGLGAVSCGIQGALVGVLGANPIIITIGAGALQLGIASKATSQSTVYPPAGAAIGFLRDTVVGVSISVFVLLVLVVAADFWLRRSRLGREIFLAGENRRAARAAGLRTTRVDVVAFALAGACAGIGGILIGANDGNATLLTGGDRYTYDAIAAVLVGGALITGGRGKTSRTALGAIVVAAVSDMLLLRGYSSGVQTVVTGLLVLLVITTMQLRRTRVR